MRTDYFSSFTVRHRARSFAAVLLLLLASLFNQTTIYAVGLINPDCSKLFTTEHTLCGQNDILFSDDSCAPPSDSISSGGSEPSAPSGSTAADPDGWTYPTVQESTSISSDYRAANRPGHRGVDLAGPMLTPIYASRDGTVTHAGNANDPNGFGNWVVIQHDENGQRVDSVYGHMPLDSITVKPGDTVKAGQQIAGIGNEGGSTGPHLHYEEWPGGRGGGSDRKPVAVYGGDAVPPSQPSSPANQAAAAQQSTTPPEEEACKSAETGAGPDNGGTCQEAQPGVSNDKIIWDYLRGRGLSEAQTAGVMGNLRQESGPNLDPGINEAVPSHAGAGYGIAQWTGSRRTAIEAAAQAKGVPVNDLCFQLDYLVEESMSRQSKDGSKGEWDGLKQQQSVEDAVDYWHENYERSADANTATRQQYAREYMKKYGS